MKCQDFDNLLPEWLSGRLSAEMADRMAAHESRCTLCARLASDEAGLRNRWSTWEQDERIPDLWPRIQSRIDREPQTSVRSPGFRLWLPLPATRWATACAFALVLAIAVPTQMRTRPLAVRPDAPISAPAPRPPAAQTATEDTSTFDPSGQSDTSVDDPIEPNVEQQWIRIVDASGR
ncbi:MAG: hypothetical protein ACLQVD_03490 [Capsulimonadaceae bacterium]